MPTIEQMQKLLELIKTLPESALVGFDPECDDESEWYLEPVTVSCDGAEIIGYMVTNKPTMN